MSFRNGNSLRTEYERVKAARARSALFGFFAGTVVGGFVFRDVGESILSGIVLSASLGLWRSIDVSNLEKIIYPGGKR